jgi:hypothetical protein
MKPAGIVFSAFLFATAIQAADPATPPPANPAQPDSPLVAASKRAHRLGKKPGFVITNDNLSSLSGPARITTTNHVLCRHRPDRIQGPSLRRRLPNL